MTLIKDSSLLTVIDFALLQHLTAITGSVVYTTKHKVAAKSQTRDVSGAEVHRSSCSNSNSFTLSWSI
jgi:hypothetical protein